MKIETLKSRIENATKKIEKKTNTIAKKEKQIEKKMAKLEALGCAGMDREKYYEVAEELGEKKSDVYWTICDIESLNADIVRGQSEIDEARESLAKYEAQMKVETEKESVLLTEIPESMKRMRVELVECWDEYDKAHRDHMREIYREMGYSDFVKKYRFTAYEAMQKTDEQIHNDNEKSAKELILNLYNRVVDITGQITDWSGIHATAGTWGCTTLNGLVIGEKGTAEVESILAGGYNIQRLHIRVLVKKH